MRKLALFILLALTFKGYSQAIDHNPLITADWKLLTLLEYKMNKSGYYYRYFPLAVKALNNKKVTLPGYIVPVKSGLLHTDFLLSVLPVMQCQFCGQGDIPPMVLVHLTKPIRYIDDPIWVTGLMVLNEKDENSPEYLMISATATTK